MPGKFIRKDVIKGYETRLIEGITVHLHKEVLEESALLNNEPLTVLSEELDSLTQIMTEKMLKALRTVQIFVEWNDLDLEDPTIVAKYYAGRKNWVLRQGKVHRRRRTSRLSR